MGKFPDQYKTVEGKTYTLFGLAGTTLPYYRKIADLADLVLDKAGDIRPVLETIQSHSGRKQFLDRSARKRENSSLISFILHHLNELHEFTENVDDHLKGLSFRTIRDPRLGTTRDQYHLYMLEIELTNRLNKSEFQRSAKKIALLPHCLQDFTVECKSSPDGFDYRCWNCSKNCYQNHVTRLLKDNGVDAYIWMGDDLRKKAKSILRSHKTLGILGIACIPELMAGMRKCQKHHLPVIGLPLDANRCARWMGEFHENSVNLEMLEKLVKG